MNEPEDLERLHSAMKTYPPSHPVTFPLPLSSSILLHAPENVIFALNYFLAWKRLSSFELFVPPFLSVSLDVDQLTLP